MTAGARLAAAYHRDVVGPLLEHHRPGLPHATARLGSDSNVLGLDDALTTDQGAIVDGRCVRGGAAGPADAAQAVDVIEDVVEDQAGDVAGDVVQEPPDVAPPAAAGGPAAAQPAGESRPLPVDPAIGCQP